MTPAFDVERQVRRANSRQIGAMIASQLTGGKRLISPQVTEGVSGLSQREMRRRADRGRFPQPIKLGEGKNGRIAYVESEVLEWVAARIEERDRAVAAGDPEPEPEPDLGVEHESVASPGIGHNGGPCIDVARPRTQQARDAQAPAITERSTAPQRRQAGARPRQCRGADRRS